MGKTPNFVRILKRVWDEESQTPINVYVDGSSNNFKLKMGAGVVLQDPHLRLTSTDS